jgi:subtilisin family serine protease
MNDSFLRMRVLCVLGALWCAGALIVATPSAQQRRERYREVVDGYEVWGGEVLVRFRAFTPATLQQAAQDVDADENERVGSTGWRRIHSASRGAAGLIAALRRRGDVLAVEPNFVLHATSTPNDPQFPQLWGLQNLTTPGADIHATSAWNISTGSRANVVGVIDTGIDYTHPDLAANVWSAPSDFTVTVGGTVLACLAGSHGFNATVAPYSCDPMDNHYHGTHVSGTIGAVGNNGLGVAGVNWSASIMGLKFLDAAGNGSTTGAIAAIEFARKVKTRFSATGAANVRVLSNSYGGGGYSQAFYDEVQAAADAEMLFVAAAGNSTTNNDAAPFYPASFAVSNVIAVAATDSTDTLASFSNYGATSVHLAAPGVGILSTLSTTRGGGYGRLDGTSMATPHVSGAAALVLSACSQTTTQLKTTLLNSVDVLPALASMVVTHGRLNVDRAIRNCSGAPPDPPGTATFVRTDTTTRGTWRGVYGLDGYALANDAASLPAYAQVVFTGNTNWTWAASTADVRALQRPTTTDRVAATWYGDTYHIDVNLTDAATHQVAFYLLDWDAAGRIERIDVLDATSGLTLDTRTASGFAGGQYLVWNLTGHVRIRVTLTAGINAVASGLFFDTAGPPNVLPTVTLTNPAPNASYTAPATISLEATASDSDGSIARVDFFYGQTTFIGTGVLNSGVYGFTWNSVGPGAYALTAVATDNRNGTKTSTPVNITVADRTGGPTASFVRTDTTTQGTWRGVYGVDGYALANDAASLPAYAQVAFTGNLSWTWAASTTDVRALQRPTTSDRIAATWYGASYTIDVNLTDTATHRVEVYFLDWDAAGRIERIDVLDATSGLILDTRTASGFAGGQYLVWDLSGHVKIRVAVTSGINAVASGLFFDTAGPPNVLPTVTLTDPAPGASYTAPATIALGATASDSDGSIARVDFFYGQTTFIGTGVLNSGVYGFTWNNVGPGTYTLTAVATDNRNGTKTSTPVSITVAGSSTAPTASFVRTDTATQGTWTGVYGLDGYALANDASSLPAYAQVAFTGNLSWTWASSTTSVRGLQRPAGIDRVASTWYTGPTDTYTIDLNLTDSAVHQVALYLLDWDTPNRTERIDIVDPITSAVLSSRTASGFSLGHYLVWDVSGHVTVRITRTGGVNAVVSGLFFR